MRWTSTIAILLLAACGGSGSGTGGGSGTTTPTTGGPQPEIATIRITDDVYALQRDTYFNVFVKTSEGVVVIDPVSDPAAEQMTAAIRELAPDAPLLAIIYSHWHLDHATGANVLRREFGADVPIIAHERAKAKLESYEGRGIEDVPLPTQTVGDEMTALTFGDKTFELHYLGHAHTNTMLVVRIVEDGVLYACDFVQNEGVGYSNLPGVDVHEQIAMLYRVLELDFQHTAFGHTPPGDRGAIEAYLGYFEAVWESTERAIADGLDADASAARVTSELPQYSSWLRADEWYATNVEGVHRWLSSHPGAVRPSGPTPIPPPTPEARAAANP